MISLTTDDEKLYKAEEDYKKNVYTLQCNAKVQGREQNIDFKINLNNSTVNNQKATITDSNIMYRNFNIDRSGPFVVYSDDLSTKYQKEIAILKLINSKN